MLKLYELPEIEIEKFQFEQVLGQSVDDNEATDQFDTLPGSTDENGTTNPWGDDDDDD